MKHPCKRTEASLLQKLRDGLGEIVSIFLGVTPPPKNVIWAFSTGKFFRVRNMVPNAQETYFISASFIFLYYFSLLS